MSRLRRPSPAMVVALVGLFVALGGTSYAVIKLPAASVGTRELKRNAVTGAKIRDGSVGSADLAAQARTGVRGVRGPEGPAGPPGPSAAGAEGWKPLQLVGSWATYGGVWASPAYRKDTAGRVFLRGLVVKGTGAPVADETIAVLPPGYAPTGRLMFTAMMSGASAITAGRLDVTADGEIRWYFGPAGDPDYTSLATISFWAD